MQYKQNKLLHGVVNNIVFKDNAMLIEQSGENTSATAEINYEAVWRVYETKEFIYVYVNPCQAHIVDKSTVMGGTAMDLRMLLVLKIGEDKYKLKCKI